MIDSIWTRTARLPRFKRLEGDLKTDVLVIGGGITGLLCAWMLKRAGADCAVVEAGRICGGTTGGTTGKITAQHGLIYRRLLREFGPEAARLYRQAQEAALERYRALCRETGCDFEERDSFVYSLTNHQALEEELEALSRIGAPAVLIREPPLPFPVAGAVQFPRQAQFHPLKFLAALAKDLPVYEYTRVLAWQPGSVRTERGTIRAEKMIAATHFPFVSNHGAYFLKLYQSRSYVVALENAPDVGGMYVGAEKTGTGGRGPEVLSQSQNRLPLGGPGLHVSGRDALRWPVRRKYAGAVRRLRVQQVGHDRGHGGGGAADRPGTGPGEPLRWALRPGTDRPAASAGGEPVGIGSKSADPHRAPVSPYGLRFEVQPSGTFLGLPLSRLPIHGGRKSAGRPGKWRQAHVNPRRAARWAALRGSLYLRETIQSQTTGTKHSQHS